MRTIELIVTNKIAFLAQICTYYSK